MSDSEEEILIFAEFDENVNIGNYRSIHALGVESKNPIIQMDDTFFIGKYENPIGTYMFFEEDREPQTSDTLFDRIPEKPLKFQCKTRKSIVMEHSYVTPKEGKLPEPQPDEKDIELVNFNSIQEAIEKFKTALIPEATATPTMTNEKWEKETDNKTKDVMEVDENAW